MSTIYYACVSVGPIILRGSSIHIIRVRYIIILPRMMGNSFVLVELTRLIVSEPKQSQWIQAWSHRTGVNFHFWWEKNSILLCFCLTTSVLTHFYLWWRLNLKNRKFLFAFKTFYEETKRFLSYQICYLKRNLELIVVWWIAKETFLF